MVCANAAFGHFNLDNALPKRSFDVPQLRERERERVLTKIFPVR